jgi:hypothetical protein
LRAQQFDGEFHRCWPVTPYKSIPFQAVGHSSIRRNRLIGIVTFASLMRGSSTFPPEYRSL